MTNHYPGPFIKNLPNKPTFAQQIKGLSFLAGKNVLPDVIMPKPKRDYKPRPNARHAHKQPERQLHKEIVSFLRLHGCYGGTIRVEAPQYRGFHIKTKDLLLGVPDTIWFHPKNGMFFVEIKYGDNKLSIEQEMFKRECISSGIRFITARKIEDILCIISP